LGEWNKGRERPVCDCGLNGGKQVNKLEGSSASKHNLDDEIALIDAVRAGDVVAFKWLVEKYDRQVFGIARHITQQREDAEDVVQETFLKAFRKLPQFEGRCKFSTWLTRIAVNESLTFLRKRRVRVLSIAEECALEESPIQTLLADWAPNPEQLYSQSELRDILAKAAQTLTPALNAVFALRDVAGLSIKEAAEALELTEASVKTRLFRARMHLREVLSGHFLKPRAPNKEYISAASVSSAGRPSI
jgi:RNA polymerase sigma-70 factor, ECF subfamily